jgi:hypothetical protein
MAQPPAAASHAGAPEVRRPDADYLDRTPDQEII